MIAKQPAKREQTHPVCLHAMESTKRWRALIHRMIRKQQVKNNDDYMISVGSQMPNIGSNSVDQPLFAVLYQAKIFLVNSTPKELTPCKISHICHCHFKEAEIGIIQARWYKQENLLQKLSP